MKRVARSTSAPHLLLIPLALEDMLTTLVNNDRLEDGKANPYKGTAVAASAAAWRHVERWAYHYAILLAAFDEQGINRTNGYSPSRRSSLKARTPRIQPDTQCAHRGFGEARTAPWQ